VISNDLVLVDGTRIRARRDAVPISVQETYRDWVAYVAGERGDVDVTLIDVDQLDHLPPVVKTRALRRLGQRVVVLGHRIPQASSARLREAGASQVVERSNGLDHLIRAIAGIDVAMPVRQGSGTAGLRSEEVPRVPGLTDRQLQVMSIFVDARAPTTAQIGAYLGLAHESVRRYLVSGRRRYVEFDGSYLSTRAALRARLVADGWLIG
jgi:hypothetical protein